MTGDRIVVDASLVILAVTDRTAAGSHARELMRGRRRDAPHLIDAEIGNALRSMVLRADVSEEAADRARRLAERAIHRRHRHDGPLSELAWKMRHDVTFYDGLYVALARALDCPLVTADHRLARSLQDRQPVEVV